jgi:DNA-binding NarL/FixJ family response regulator
MDVRLPGQSAIETTRQIVKRYPHVRVIVFAYQPDETYMEQAYQAGAKGFLVLSDSRCDVVQALHGVLSGESPVSSALAEAWAGLSARTAAVDTGSGVTARERQVLNMIAAGYSNQAIADEMGISKRTVEVHRRNLKAKLKTKNSAQMIQAALRLGLITLKP